MGETCHSRARMLLAAAAAAAAALGVPVSVHSFQRQQAPCCRSPFASTVLPPRFQPQQQNQPFGTNPPSPLFVHSPTRRLRRGGGRGGRSSPAPPKAASRTVLAATAAASKKANADANAKSKAKRSKSKQPFGGASSSSPAAYASVGQAIQSSSCTADLLSAASCLWVPSDPDLPPHYGQEVHHEKRQRWAGQLLAKLGNSCRPTGQQGANANANASVWSDERLVRAIQASAEPYPTRLEDRADGVEGRAVLSSLIGLASLAGRVPPPPPSCSFSADEIEGEIEGEAEGKEMEINHQVLKGVSTLIHRIEEMGPRLDLRDVLEGRWAARTLLARVPGLAEICRRRLTTTPVSETSSGDIGDEEEHQPNDLPLRAERSGSEGETDAFAADILLPKLGRRVSDLPFDVIPLGVNWVDVLDESTTQIGSSTNIGIGSTSRGNESGGGGSGGSILQSDLVSTLREAIPFNFDTIVTRTGASVVERRGTAWLAEDGIGALAYSGKLMVPRPVPEVVRAAMRATERVVLPAPPAAESEGPSSSTFFDCALCNHYPDPDAACKFHTDPEHGSHWDRLTCVVAAGDDRKFAFRPIPGLTVWDEWDGYRFVGGRQQGKKSTTGDSSTSNAPAVVHLFPGDVVKMWDSCNDDFHHAVYADDDDEAVGVGQGGAAAMLSPGRGRVSLVFKRAIDRGGIGAGRSGQGVRGHGLVGEGRRSRKRKRGGGGGGGPTTTEAAEEVGVRRSSSGRRRRQDDDRSKETAGRRRRRRR